MRPVGITHTGRLNTVIVVVVVVVVVAQWMAHRKGVSRDCR
jgi:hypothetical protein